MNDEPKDERTQEQIAEDKRRTAKSDAAMKKWAAERDRAAEPQTKEPSGAAKRAK